MEDKNHHNGLNLKKKNEKNLGKVYKSFVILKSQTLNLLTVHFKGFFPLFFLCKHSANLSTKTPKLPSGKQHFYAVAMISKGYKFSP